MDNKNKVLAIIPARGGSKGIPRKNVQPLLGRPLISYTINNALESRYINKVVVSTDDIEISNISQQYGSEVVWRPENISGDTVSSEAALLHAISYLEEYENYSPDIIVFLQCTSPLTLVEDVDKTIEILINKNADSALAVTEFHYFLWKNDDKNNFVGINHNANVRLMRQERESQYIETGAVYVMRASGFLEKRHRFFGKVAYNVIPLERRLEIDDPIDFEIAEVLLRERQKLQVVESIPQKISALIMDFDGVFTDNKVIVNEKGEEAVICSRGDGMGISEFRKLQIPMLVLTSEKNPVFKHRCDKLGIEYKVCEGSKLGYLNDWLNEREINISDVIYIGNDINDIECIRNVGLGVVVSDANEEVKKYAKLILENKGGNGAIREIAELISLKLKRMANYETRVRKYSYWG